MTIEPDDSTPAPRPLVGQLPLEDQKVTIAVAPKIRVEVAGDELPSALAALLEHGVEITRA